MKYSYKGKIPQIHDSVFLAPNATIVGEVEIGADSSLWFNVVARADVNYIRIGEKTNIQDGSILHVTFEEWPLHIGNSVTVGHGAILHGCTVADYCLIGMGSRILDGAHIGSNCLVAAGSLVRENEKVPSNSLVAGVPAIVKRSLTSEEIERIKLSAERYVGYKNQYLQGGFKGVER
ncbi:MAG: gamma carbonic anhydrase family protein [bacterium]